MSSLNKTIPTLLLPFFLLTSCDDEKKDLPVLENKRRIECEKNSRICNGKDGMRFYQSAPMIYQDSNGNVKIREIWSSFVACCDVFPRLMDSLTLYNHLLDSAIKHGHAFNRSDSIGNIIISGGLYYYGELYEKRAEWIHFGDSSFTWSMPTGKYFNEHKTELEGAYARCCL